MDAFELKLVTPESAGDDLPLVRSLFKKYAKSIKVDLSFQGFAEELANPLTLYGPPRGALLLARFEDEAAGCCALRPLDDCDYANACEMKRLFVRKPFRRFGLGRQLIDATMDAARQAGYSHVLLDTLDNMEAARALYQDFGFVEIEPYYHNPLPGAHYLKAELS